MEIEASLFFFDIEGKLGNPEFDNTSVKVLYEHASLLQQGDILSFEKAETEGFKPAYWLDGEDVYRNISGNTFRVFRREWCILPNLNGEEKSLLIIEVSWENTID